MTKFEPDSPEARAWVQFMTASLSRVHPAASAIQADAALEEFKKRLKSVEESCRDALQEVGVPYPIQAPRPDRSLDLTKDQRQILKSASKVHRVKFRLARRKAMDQLVGMGLLDSCPGDGWWYAITPAGREAIR